MTLAVDWLARRAELSPRKIALVDTRRAERITFREWNARANRTAHWMQERLGLERGDRLAVLASNCVEYLDLWFACSKTGAILHNLNWRLTVRELEILLRAATPRALVYSGEFAGQAHALRACLPELDRWASLAIDETNGRPVLTERERYPDTPPPRPALTLDDPWVICYTGGTTGVPKGAILTYGNITWNAINTAVSWGLDAEDVAILNAPLFHTGGLNVFTAPLVHLGGTSIVCAGFDPDQVFDLVESGEVSLFFGVPTMFIVLQQHPRWAGADFSRLKLVISGGAPCPRPVFERFWDKGVDFKTGYGLTEAGPNTFWLPKEDVRRKPGAVGRPLFHVEVKLLDMQGHAVTGAEQVGELLVRGPHCTPGYWNNAEATAAAIDDEGWLHTGDLAQRDAEGYYSIIGRSKDMLVSGGENVYPAEVESVLFGHPAVAEVALIGLPDPKWGEVGCAVVVLRAGQAAGADELTAYCRKRLAGYKTPRSFVFVESLPKTGAGKVDKKWLQETYSR